MQLSETPKQTNSLFNAMHRFLGAVNNMDQTVMVPSLLRDLPLDQDLEMSAGKTAATDLDEEQGDMYGYYQLLKSIRRDIEWGVRRAAATEAEDRDQDQDQEEMRRMRRRRMGGKSTRTSSTASLASMSSSASTSSSSSCSSEEEEDEEDEDLQKQLQFHLTGLHGVLSKLTLQAHTLTNRYKQEVGIGGWGQ